MNSAEFHIKRHALGLSAQDVADVFEVNIRTVQRWETTHTPPLDVATWLDERWETMCERVDQVMQIAESGEEVTLLRYRRDSSALTRQHMSVGEHDALLGHMIMLLTMSDYDFTIEDIEA
ncbi:hypothetical protein ACXM2N_03580 [Corynebacterium sp. ZY180755]